MNSNNSSAPMENPENLPTPTLRKYEYSLHCLNKDLEMYPRLRMIYQEAIIDSLKDLPGVLFMRESIAGPLTIFQGVKYPPHFAAKIGASQKFLEQGWTLTDVRDAPQSEGVPISNPITE